jgi:hypothetical protein
MKGQDQTDQMQHRAEAIEPRWLRWVGPKKIREDLQISWFYDVYVCTIVLLYCCDGLWAYVPWTWLNMAIQDGIPHFKINPFICRFKTFRTNFEKSSICQGDLQQKRHLCWDMLSVGQVHESTFITQVKRCYKIGPVLDSSWSQLLYASFNVEMTECLFWALILLTNWQLEYPAAQQEVH